MQMTILSRIIGYYICRLLNYFKTIRRYVCNILSNDGRRISYTSIGLYVYRRVHLFLLITTQY